jgi:hypothetical protein
MYETDHQTVASGNYPHPGATTITPWPTHFLMFVTCRGATLWIIHQVWHNECVIWSDESDAH